MVDGAAKSRVLSDARRSLIDWMIGDCWKAVDGRAMVGALILGVCAIDVLGSLLAGKKGTNATFKKFARRYLPHSEKYTDSIYDGMRNRLVHNYSSKGFSYTDDHPELHLSKHPRGDLVLNVESFLEDVQSAAEEYLADLSRDDELFNRFVSRTGAQGYGLLGPVLPNKPV